MDFLKALSLLQNGDVIGLPTETVYGLAGDATNRHAIAKIYALKGRPSFNPLIIHSHSLDQLKDIVEFDETAIILAEHFWPGPVTLVLKRKENCPIDLLASAGMDTLAVRIPKHPIALELLQQFGKPLAAPSANLSNSLSPTSKAMVLKDFPDLYVLDGDQCTIGVESTIISCVDRLTLLRPGGIAREDIEILIGKLADIQGDKILASGMLKKHYAPKTPLRLNAMHKKEGELLLGFGPIEADLNLSESANLTEAAANLFSMLNQLDQMGAKSIAISPIPEHRLGVAINDRLRRAASI